MREEFQRKIKPFISPLGNRMAEVVFRPPISRASGRSVTLLPLRVAPVTT